MPDHLAEALKHPDLARLRSQLDRRDVAEVEEFEGSRRAAVAAVLRVVDEPELLFIKRAEVPHDPWSGHIAFPGGRHEPDDRTLADTAIRETHEELALELCDDFLIGRLDDLAPRNTTLPPIIVRPFVAIVRPDVILVPSHEVAATFWVPLTVLRHPETQAEYVMTVNDVRARFPAYRVHEHLVWGMTERIVRQLLSLLD